VPPPPLPRVGTYRSTVVWGTGTGVDTSAYDNVSGYALNQPGLSVDGIGRDQIRAYAPPATPAFDLTLTNWDRRFSPGGPIGGFVGRGSAAYLDVDWGIDQSANAADVQADDPLVLANGTETVRLFDGILNTAEHTLTRPQRSVQLRALGHLASLLDKKPLDTADAAGAPKQPQLYENIRTDEAVSILLDAVGWPAGMRSISQGSTTLSYWWLDGQTTGTDVLNALLGAEGAGGCAYEQAGVFHFEGRQTRQTATRSLDSQWIFSDGFSPDPFANDARVNANDDTVLANGQSELLLFDINPSETVSNPDEVVRSVAVSVNQRVAVPTQVGGPPSEVGKIWEYGGPLVLAPNQVVVTETLLSDPYKEAVPPVRQPAGGGPGPYDYDTLPAGAAVTPVLLQASGIRVAIQWTAGPAPVTVVGVTSNGPQLRALSLVAAGTVVRSTVDTSAMSIRYAGRDMQWSMWPEITPGQAEAIANSMCIRYMQERRQATIRLVNLDSRHMWALLHLRISDRVTWLQKHGEINEPFWIEQLSHEIAPGGGLHVVTVGLERVFGVTGGRFDGAKYGIDVFGD
jgi:hypothetical protein